MEPSNWVTLFIALSAIAFGFMLYSMKFRSRLGIRWTHPRIWVEGLLMIIFLIVAIYLNTKFKE